MMHPICGNCGYDLSGSEANRCPECGRLFIEAGLKLRRGATGQRRRARWMIAMSVIALLGIGGFAATVAHLRAEAARAVALQKAALAKQRAVLQALKKDLTTSESGFESNQKDRRGLVTDPAVPDQK